MQKNPIAPSVKVTLDRERTLLLDMNAMANLEEALGVNPLDLFIELAEAFQAYAKELEAFEAGERARRPSVPITPRQVRAILWACIRADEDAREVPEAQLTTLRQVGALVHPGNLEELMSTFNGLATRSLPEAEGDSKAPLPEAASASA